MFLFSILFCIPYWLKFRYTRELGLHETELGKNPHFNRIVHFWMYLPIAYFIPLIILVITNVYLIGTIMLARQRRQRLGMSGHTNSSLTTASASTATATQPMLKNGGAPAASSNNNNNNHRMSHQEEKRASVRRRTTNAGRGGGGGGGGNMGAGGMNITIMLIAVVFLFFCCQCPVLILHIMQSMFCMDSETDRFRCQASAFYQYAQVVAKFLLVCNLSLNFACYCLFSQKFRQVLRETLPALPSLSSFFSPCFSRKTTIIDARGGAVVVGSQPPQPV